MMSAHLSDSYLEDRKRHLPRAVPVHAGDTVKIMRGDDAGKEGKVAGVNYRKMRITIEGITHAKADGSQVSKLIHPSNVVITKLDETDPLRLKKFEGARQ